MEVVFAYLKSSKVGGRYANLLTFAGPNRRATGHYNPVRVDHRDPVVELHSGWRDQHQWHRCHRCDATRGTISHPGSRPYGDADPAVPEYPGVWYVSASCT